MTAHPTTAQLAAFRRAIGPDWRHRSRTTAWPDERQHGIGASSFGKAWGVMFPDSTLPGEARREASAMRSRAARAGAWAIADVLAFAPTQHVAEAVSDLQDGLLRGQHTEATR